MLSWQSPQRLYEAVFARATYRSARRVALAVAAMAVLQYVGWTGLKVPIKNCAGLEELPVPMTEDVTLFFDGVDAVVCDSVSDGGREL